MNYVGYTSNFKERLARHQRGEVKFTSKRLPVEIVAVISVKDKYTAIKLEDYFKTGSGRAFTQKHFIKKV